MDGWMGGMPPAVRALDFFGSLSSVVPVSGYPVSLSSSSSSSPPASDAEASSPSSPASETEDTQPDSSTSTPHRSSVGHDEQQIRTDEKRRRRRTEEGSMMIHSVSSVWLSLLCGFCVLSLWIERRRFIIPSSKSSSIPTREQRR